MPNHINCCCSAQCLKWVTYKWCWKEDKMDCQLRSNALTEAKILRVRVINTGTMSPAPANANTASKLQLQMQCVQRLTQNILSPPVSRFLNIQITPPSGLDPSKCRLLIPAFLQLIKIIEICTSWLYVRYMYIWQYRSWQIKHVLQNV